MRVLTIQDLSCVGKCSLTVAQPILSAMGISCSVLPTAILSTHTAFPKPYVRSLTEDMPAINRHWQENNVTFDAILVGYLSDPEQAAALLEIIESFDCPVILDPVMGDYGKLYSSITTEHVDAMRDLSCLAKVLLPNVTEASFLTNLPYQSTTDGHYLRQMLQKLQRNPDQSVIITGISPDEQHTGYAGLQGQDGLFSYSALKKHSVHGTGDMFSAVFTGAYVLGKEPYEAAELAAKFVERVLDATENATPFGAEFEGQLPWLWSQV